MQKVRRQASLSRLAFLCVGGLGREIVIIMRNECASVMAVFEAVSQCGEVSRAELSDITGFSLVTVGKAVDELCRCGLMSEYKRSRPGVGRRCGICSIPSEHRMILIDMSHSRTTVRICDLRLNVLHEYTETDKSIGEIWLGAFSNFTEMSSGELLGMGVIVPEGKTAEFSKAFKDEMGNSPELVVEEVKAYAMANSARTNTHTSAVIARLFADGKADGALTYSGTLYSGAHGYADGFSRITHSQDSFLDVLYHICEIIDPETVHIACENSKDCKISEKLADSLLKNRISEDNLPKIIAEPMSDCALALDGAAKLLRNQQVMIKLSKNS